MVEGTGPAQGSDEDVSKAYGVCAATAYPDRPDSERHLSADDWADAWVHGAVTSRAKELVDTERFRRLRRAVEHALDTHLTIEAEQVRAIMSAADQTEDHGYSRRR